MPPVPKPSRVHDEAWLDEVRRMPCCVCEHLNIQQWSRTEPNHTKTRGSFGGDDSVAPMCHMHHMLWHLIGNPTFVLRFGIDPIKVAAKLWHDHISFIF